MTFREFESKYDKVKYLMEKHPNTRDCDFKLSYLYIFFESEGSDYLKSINGLEFLTELANGRYTSTDCITRARRKVQENCPELRGNNYKERQTESKTFKTKINEL